jgi:uncharacterized protein YeaO (DUF488 family)
MTSYYGKLKEIKEAHPDWLLISISGWIPDEILNGVDTQDKSLAPSKDIYNEYQEAQDWQLYTRRFKSERLIKIDLLEKLERWETIANENNKNTENIVLFCYEKVETEDNKGEFCHRFIVAEAIEKEFNTTVIEYGYPNYERINYRMTPKFNTDFLF